MSSNFLHSTSLVEDCEVFEITDFTTASEWEKFISALEEVLNEWKLHSSQSYQPLPKDIISKGLWSEVKEDIAFADFKFMVIRHYLQFEVDSSSEGHEEVSDKTEQNYVPAAIRDLSFYENDFPAKAHCLARWFGLRDFIIIIPVIEDSIVNESRIKILLSSLNIAVINTGCEVPIFIQIDKSWRRLYAGVCEGGGLRADFEMIHMKRIPKQYKHLSGLLDMFKKKIAYPMSPHPSVSVSIRFTYMLNHWSENLLLCDLPEIDYNSEAGGNDFVPSDFRSVVPFGACEDPISDVQLMVTWPRISEEMVVDEELYSDLEPTSAAQWAAGLRFVEDPQCLMGEALRLWMKLCRRRETVEELLGGRDEDGMLNAVDKVLEEQQQQSGAAALDRLTRAPVSARVPAMADIEVGLGKLSRMRHRLKRAAVVDAPLDDETLRQLLAYLFPDARATKVEEEVKETIDEEEVQMSQKVKAAPISSLTHRLAVAALVLHQSHGGIHAVAHMWHEVVLELRYRWEGGHKLPEDVGPVDGVAPDTSSCLLHQKLQLLNLCIMRKLARDKRASEIEISEEEDEFEDALEEQEEVVAAGDDRVMCGSGKLKKCGDLCLLNSPAHPLWIPVTQPGVPMTEDMLEEQAAAMTALGTTQEGTALRARMQSASLVSDMEAFKAANPCCALEDFVRWYSPRDYSQDEGLSPRMKLPGNLWEEAWQAARSVPARNQKRLFDDTKEAEKVLHFLAALRPAEVALHLLPNVCVAALLQLHRERDGLCESQLQKRLEQLSDRLSTISRDHLPPVTLPSISRTAPQNTLKVYSELVRGLSQVEILLCRNRSLRLKLLSESALRAAALPSDQRVQVEEVLPALLTQPEVPLVGAARGPVGKLLQAALLRDTEDPELLHDSTPGTSSSSSCNGFPPPSGKEFILRCLAQRPAPFSRPTPHRMYCVLSPEEFRFAGVFCSDTVFF